MGQDQQVREHEIQQEGEQEEIKKVNKKKEDSKSKKKRGKRTKKQACSAAAAFSAGDRMREESGEVRPGSHTRAKTAITDFNNCFFCPRTSTAN